MKANVAAKKYAAKSKVWKDALNKEDQAYRVVANTEPFSGMTPKDVQTSKDIVADQTQGQQKQEDIPSVGPTPEQLKQITSAKETIKNLRKRIDTVKKRKIEQAPKNVFKGAQGYKGSSIVDYLSQSGSKSDIGSRASLAKKYKMGYNIGATGEESAKQNTALLKRLRGY